MASKLIESQVAIAVFYDRPTKRVIPNSLVIIDSTSWNDFVKFPKETETTFYVIKHPKDQISIKPYTYNKQAAGDSDLILLGVVHIGTTTQDANLVGAKIVSNEDIRPKSNQEDELLKWAIDTAFDVVMLDSGRDEMVVHDRMRKFRNSFVRRLASFKGVPAMCFTGQPAGFHRFLHVL